MTNLPLIDTRALQLFVVVAEERNMSSAALRLGITQSAVSQTIRNLENQMGAVLINRTARPLTLTAAGVILANRGSTAIDGLIDLAAQVADAAKGVNPSIRLGLVDSFATTCGASLARALSERTTKLSIKTGLTPGLKQQLQRRELDVIVCAERIDAAAGITCQEILSERYIALLPEAHYSPAVTMKSLAELTRSVPLIRFDLGSHSGMQIEEIVRSSEIRSAPLLQFDTADTLTSMVGVGLGWAITTPLCALQAQHLSAGTRLARIEDLESIRTIYMLSRTEQEAPYADELLDLCRVIAHTGLLPRLRQLDPFLEHQITIYKRASPRSVAID